jgi:hypothetical protein
VLKYSHLVNILNMKKTINKQVSIIKNAEINNTNKMELLYNRMIPVSYFEMFYYDNSKMDENPESIETIGEAGTIVPMFFETDNEPFKKICRLELKEILAAIKDGNKVAPSIHKSRDYINQYASPEAEKANLIALFDEKFMHGKLLMGYKTEIVFAKNELADLENRKTSFARFGIFNQWISLLKEITAGEFLRSNSDENIASDDSAETCGETRTNNFNKLPIQKVQKYFMQLAENKSENGGYYLTKNEVIKFIGKAFCGETANNKVTVNIKQGEQFMVWKLFYNFFNDCTTNSEWDNKKQGNKKKYVQLLTDNVTNWKYQKVFNNFGKSEVKYWKKLKDFT